MKNIFSNLVKKFTSFFKKEKKFTVILEKENFKIISLNKPLKVSDLKKIATFSSVPKLTGAIDDLRSEDIGKDEIYFLCTKNYGAVRQLANSPKLELAVFSLAEKTEWKKDEKFLIPNFNY